MRSSGLYSARHRVPEAFDRAARSYDFLTGLNPGYHRHLEMSAARLGLEGSVRVLDVCCGTGASTRALADALPRAEIVAVDASRGMLERAQAKGFPDSVRFVHGDAMNLLGAKIEGSFDGILVAYGIRNVSDIDACLGDLLTCLRPGGRICFHEYSVADSARGRWVWRIVTSALIVPAGLLTSGSAELYRYLRRSVLSFDGADAFQRRLRVAGFVNVRVEPMDGWQRGIVHSFVAERPAA